MSISTITIGAVNYTANASVAEADAYLAVDPTRATVWTALTTDQKGQKLVAATRRLNLLPWAGEKTGGEGTQEDAFPRTGLTYADGTAVSTSDVPIEVENATILLAGSIALAPTAGNAGTSGSNQKRVKAGSAEVEFFRVTTGVVLQDETAYGLISQFLATSQASTGTTGALASGTDGESSFGRTDGGLGLWTGFA